MSAAAREGSHMLRGSFGEASWKVALEPGCPTAACVDFLRSGRNRQDNVSRR